MFFADISECKVRLLTLLEKEYEGAVIRCRVRAVDRVEEPLNIFRTKEGSRAKFSTISMLDVDATVTLQIVDIAQAFVNLCVHRFSATEIRTGRLLEECHAALPKIPSEVQKTMNDSITTTEIECVIKKLASRKSAGVDGLGSVFYRKFSGDVAPALCSRAWKKIPHELDHIGSPTLT